MKTAYSFFAGVVTLATLLASCALPPSLAPADTPKPRTTATAVLNPAARVDLVVMPDAGASWLLQRIERAQVRVLAKMYLLTDNRFIQAMQTARRNGATVQVLIEPTPFGAVNIANEAFKDLKRAGLDVKHTSPAFRLTHEKSFVIDDEAVILTANATRSAFSRNREFAAITRDPVDVHEVAAAFEADWNRRPFSAQSNALVWSPTSSRGRIGALIASAQQSLDVYALSVGDDDVIRAMREAAQRGVRVRLIASPPSRTDGEDSDTAGLDALQRGSAQVRLMTSPFVHAKVFVADGRLAFVGSINISTASLDYNRELGIIFDDAAAVSRVMGTFEKDWAKAVER